MREIDIKNWNRKEHFEFFSTFDLPNFGIVTEVDCTIAYKKAKEKNYSFFAYYLHKSILVANRIREFRYRLINGKVYELDLLNAGSTIARDDGTFAFAYIHFSEKFDEFNYNLQQEINAVKNSRGLRLEGELGKYDLIRHTVVPWITFTDLLHPKKFDKNDSIPKIAFGKIYEKDNRKYMPVSVEAHHALLDGYHISLYIKEFQKELNSPIDIS